MSNLVGNSNYVINGDCNPITGLTVTIEITQAITVPLGMSFQLNCYSPADARCVWQQYVIMFVPSNGASPVLVWMIDNWPSDAYRQQLGLKAGSDLINQQRPIVTVPGTSPTLPANYTLVIALANDAGGNITGVTYSVTDDHGVMNSPGLIELKGLPVSNGTPQQKIDSGGIAPIYAFELNVVGQDNGEVTLLESGALTITYAATTPLLVASSPPGCAAAQNVFTEEQSNAAYAALGAGPCAAP